MPHYTEQHRILNILKELPPARVDEVVDFAEYLKTKEMPFKAKKKKKLCQIIIPTSHLGRIGKDATDRGSLKAKAL